MTVGEFWLPAEADEVVSQPKVSKAAGAISSDEPTVVSPPDSQEVEAADQHTGGMCRIEREVIEIDVVGELTPRDIQVARGVEMRRSPAAELSNFTVHGSLPVQPWSVSFLECSTIRRRANAFGMSTGTHAHQVVRATWAVTGAHVTADTSYSGFRLQVTGLEEWAKSPGLEQAVKTTRPFGSRISWTTPERYQVEFTEFDQTAVMACNSSATFGAIDVHGGHIETTNMVTLSDIDGWTLQEALTRFVVPVQILMSLLIGQRADVRCLEVQINGNWCQVYGPLIAHDEPPRKRRRREVVPILLDRNTLTLEHMVRWCASTVDLSPAPHVVAAALSGEFATVETEALTLSTTTEGLDRRLHPGERRFDDETVKCAREQLQSIEIDGALRSALLALVRHIHEPSMPQRLARLAESVATTAPSCIGRPNKWKQEVTDMRIAGAHGLETSAVSDDSLVGLHALTRSLRWALRIRLLQACGVPNADLSSALASSAEYERDERQWRALLPGIFQDD